MSSKQKAQSVILDIVDRIADVGPKVRAAMAEHPDFVEIGKRILQAWQEGIRSLHGKRVYALRETALEKAFDDFSDSKPAKVKRTTSGKSELLGRR